MRLIDVDALIETMRENAEGNEGWYGDTWAFMRDVESAPTIDAVPVETVCEMFGDEAPCNYGLNEAPCNYGLFGVSVDDFMMSKCGKWCEYNCDKVPYTECWRKFLEAIEKWRKQND